MKKPVHKGVSIVTIWCMVLGLFAGMAAPVSVSAAEGENIPVPNGSFESGLDSWTTKYTPVDGESPITTPGGWSPENGGSNRLNVWSAAPYTAEAKQTLTGMENGTYTLSAWIASGGGFQTNYMFAKTEGKPDVLKAIPVSSASWTKIELPVVVAGNQVTVGFYGEGAADTWFAVDLVHLEKTTIVEEPVTGVEIANRSFEEAGETDQMIHAWDESGDVAASFKQYNGYKSAGNLSHFADTDYKVTTSQKLSELEDSYYTLTAWAQNGGGQHAAYLFAQNIGSSEARAAVPVSADWQKVYLRGIQVVDGELTIGVKSDAKAGNWLNVDHFELVKDDKPYRLLKGGDVSELSYVESMGGKFYDHDGNEKDLFQILRENGHDIVRIRLYNEPGKGHGDGNYYRPAGFMDKADVLKLARRAKAAGLQIQFSFHYSDFWTNGATHMIPNAWQKAISTLATDAEKVTKLEEFVGSYTKEVMDALVQQGTAPEFVSLGNEMQSGLLFPYGRASGSSWENLARFLKAGSAAVKEASPESRVILHLDDAGNYNKYNDFFDRVEELNVPYDIIGPSYYPFWTDMTVEQIVEFTNFFSQKYDKDIMFMETGYNWSQTLPNGEIGQLNDNGPYSNETSTPQGQKEFMLNLFNGLKSVEGGRVIGDLYWDPIMIAVPGVGWAIKEADDQPDLNVVANTTLFDFGGKALPVHDAYKYNTEGTAYGHITGVVRGTGGNPVAGAAVKIDIGGTTYQAVSDASGNYMLVDLPLGTDYTITAAKAGYQGGSIKATEVKAGMFTSDQDIVLTGGAVSGLVKDEAGEPASSAEVAVTIGGSDYKVLTDEFGEYLLADLPVSDGVTLVASKLGYANGQLAAVKIESGKETTNANLQITLTSGSVAGTVKDSKGDAIEGAEASVTIGKLKLKSVTDAAGSYEIQHVPSGQNVEVQVVKSGYLTQAVANVQTQVGAKTSGVDFALVANIGKISGTVLDSSSKPVAGATVRAVLGESTYTAQTNGDGSYLLENVLGGTGYRLTATKSGYLAATVTGVTVTAQEITAKVALRLANIIPLANASFEQQGASNTDIPGWTTGGTAGGTFVQSHGSATDGSRALSHWMEGAFVSEAYQKVTGLADGTYEFSANVYNGGDQNEFYMYIKDKAGKVTKFDLPKSSVMTPFKVKADITGGELTVGFYADANAGNWAVIDGVTLGFLGAKEQTEPSPTPGNPTPVTPTIPIVPTPTPAPPTKVEVDLSKGVVDEASNSLTVEAKPAAGASAVEVLLPVQQLLNAINEQYRAIRILTGSAIVSLDPAMLGEYLQEDTGHVTLKVERIAVEQLSADQRERLNDNSVYEFELSVNGTQLSRFEPNFIQIDLPYTLKAGENEQQIVIYYLNDNGQLKLVPNGVYDQQSGMVRFSPVHFSKYAAAHKPVGFMDLEDALWAKESIRFMAARDFVSGYSSEQFAPNDAITRAQFVKLLMNVLALPEAGHPASFRDVKEGAWYAKALGEAQHHGLVKGKTDGSFGINDVITREEMAVILNRAMALLKVELEQDSSVEPFADADQISAYAKQAVNVISEAGLLQGTGGSKFSPQGLATRAQAAVLLGRVFKLL